MGRKPWTEGERARLLARRAAGWSHAAIAAECGRTVGAVKVELSKLRATGRAGWEGGEEARGLRDAADARRRETRKSDQRAHFALARARAGDARALAELTGLSPDDAAFWLPRVPTGKARATVAKLREIAALQDEHRPTMRRIYDGETRTGRPHGDFGIAVPGGGDWG